MEIALAGGVVIDVATCEDLARHHERLREALEGRRPTGKYYMIQGSGATTAAFAGAGPIAISFTPQSPPPGRKWFVQFAAIWVGANPATTAVASLFAALMVGRCPTGPGAPAISASLTAVNVADTVVPGQAVPSAISVPDKTIVKSQQQLYVVLAGSGLAASTVYSLNAGIIDTVDDDETYFW